MSSRFAVDQSVRRTRARHGTDPRPSGRAADRALPAPFERRPADITPGLSKEGRNPQVRRRPSRSAGRKPTFSVDGRRREVAYPTNVGGRVRSPYRGTCRARVVEDQDAVVLDDQLLAIRGVALGKSIQSLSQHFGSDLGASLGSRSPGATCTPCRLPRDSYAR